MGTLEVPVPPLALLDPQGGAFAVPTRSGVDRDVVAVGRDPPQDPLFRTEPDPAVHECSSTFLQGLLPGQLVQGLSGFGALLLGVVPLLVRSLGSEHGRPRAIGQGISRRWLGMYLSADIGWSCGRLVCRQELLQGC